MSIARKSLIFNKFLKHGNFISLPEVATRLLTILKEDDVNIAEIVKLIQRDPIATMKILKIANSPVFATSSNPVVNIDQAILTLGTRRVTDIIFSISLHSKLFVGRNLDIYPLLEKYFFHSFSVASIANLFAPYINNTNLNGLFMAGLLHDIGRVIMIQMEPMDYLRVDKLISNGIDELDAEMQIYNETHLDVNSNLAELWNLPKLVGTVMLTYRNPDTAGDFAEVSRAIYFGKQISKFTNVNGIDNFNIMNAIPIAELGKMLNKETDFEKLNEKIKSLIKDIPKQYSYFK